MKPVIRTWVVVANQSVARVYEPLGRARDWKLVAELLHPEGRMHNHEIDSDRPGRAFDSVGRGRHSMEPEVDPKKHAATLFAGEVARFLESARADSRFDELLLVAAPAFLGHLRHSLPEPTADRVRKTFDKDLAALRDHELRERLVQLIQE